MPTKTHIPRVALVGNPNAGKTSLFNAITGGSQKVGNYPGVTVERVTGTVPLGNFRQVEFVDIPGLYSIVAVSEDERVAVEALGTDSPDAPDMLVVVMDVTNLERSLYLYSQLADLGWPTVIAVTMTDTAARHGQLVDLEALETATGVPVLAVVAHRNTGLDQLSEAIEDMLMRPVVCEPIGRAQGSVVELSTEERYEWSSGVRAAVVTEPSRRRVSNTERIDMILTHRVFGLVIFVGLMYVMFQSIYTFASPIMDGIGWVFAQLGRIAGAPLQGIPWLQSLVVDGIIAGVGAVLGFLPQILILFFFIAALEGTGYMARAAFLMDKLLGWCGLNGRAFIPLLSSFACAIPGIMAARVMPDSRSRLATILVAPLMSCSARLPVYVVLIGAFIEPHFGPAWAGFALFAMHFVGLVVAIPVIFILNRRILRGKRLPFIMELPRYQWPKWRDVGVTMVQRGRSFVETAGKIIVVMSVLIWALLYFPRDASAEKRYAQEFRSMPVAMQRDMTEANFVQERMTENSFLGQFGRFIEPVFKPAGFDWRISTAILCAFPAREVVVSSMGILFSLGSDAEDHDLQSALKVARWPDGRPLFTPWTAVGLMFFFALCCQCMATLATVRRETNSWRWPAFMFVYMTGLAYLSAVAIHRIALAIG